MNFNVNIIVYGKCIDGLYLFGLNGRCGCIDRFCDIVVGISKYKRNLKWLFNFEWFF